MAKRPKKFLGQVREAIQLKHYSGTWPPSMDMSSSDQYTTLIISRISI
jgi:hypothetical protein